MRGGGFETLALELEDCVPAAPSAEEVWETREIAAVLGRWLDGLEPEDRWLFVRRYWYGDRVEQLAARRGCTAQQLTGRLYRLRQRLRRVLEQEGVVL